MIYAAQSARNEPDGLNPRRSANVRNDARSLPIVVGTNAVDAAGQLESTQTKLESIQTQT
jgi:hypothetical protein